MEYSGRHILDNRTEETLKKLKLQEPDCKIYKKVLKNWDSIAKPLDGMGRFETITAQIGAILGTDKIDISKKAVIIMCADNGIVEEGISQSGQEVTAAVADGKGRIIRRYNGGGDRSGYDSCRYWNQWKRADHRSD